jgi:peptidoglycan hydrolase-like protein with peptidoglycan-binding domain
VGKPASDAGPRERRRCATERARERRPGDRRPPPRRLRLRWAALSLAAAALALVVVGGPATARRSGEVVLKRGQSGPAVAQVQQRLDIVVDAVYGAQTERAVKRFQRRRRLRANGKVDAATRRALRLPPFARSSVYPRRELTGGSPYVPVPGAPVPPVLARIARCESGGNPRAVSDDGRYRGKYQFNQATWEWLGGTGDPAEAPEALQDRLALKLFRLRGTAPWTRCGQGAGTDAGGKAKPRRSA